MSSFAKVWVADDFESESLLTYYESEVITIIKEVFPNVVQRHKSIMVTLSFTIQN